MVGHLTLIDIAVGIADGLRAKRRIMLYACQIIGLVGIGEIGRRTQCAAVFRRSRVFLLRHQTVGKIIGKLRTRTDRIVHRLRKTAVRTIQIGRTLAVIPIIYFLSNTVKIIVGKVDIIPVAVGLLGKKSGEAEKETSGVCRLNTLRSVLS